MALGDFVTLRLIREYELVPLEASALGSKTSSPYGKVRSESVLSFLTILR